MSELEKQAYRHLLYVAMLSIRMYCQPSLNPLSWYRSYINTKIAGATADWLHNLANYSALDFKGFDENAFWEALEAKSQQYPISSFSRYRSIFDDFLQGTIQIV